jgi:hypothetical protein
LRKLQQVASEPVLRKWLVGRLLGKYAAEPAYQAHYPPYLSDALPLAPEQPDCTLAGLSARAPEKAIVLSLASESLGLEPDQEAGLFDHTFADTETLLALHRFAWLPMAGEDMSPAWVNAIWSAWRAKYGTPDDNWAWHPYTACERVINILAFAQRHGLPGRRDDTLAVLANHAPAIAARLEYFGDHHSSNHLANNGRGLFMLGLALGMPNCTNMGGRILTEEAKRIFLPSGILREGSSHYHALLTLNYAAAHRAALKHKRPEAGILGEVVGRACSALKILALPGGMPLVGDISPDCPPTLVMDGLQEMLAAAPDVDKAALENDGWLRFDDDLWSALWHSAPEGWSHMPGHGHQDCGSFEVHYAGHPVFVDPGRGAYGETGDAALYRSAQTHNTLTIDSQDPFPANKPYFDDVFRWAICGAPPHLTRTDTGIKLVHSGYMRLRAVGNVCRNWAFHNATLTIDDTVEGGGTRYVERILCTPLNVIRREDSLILGNGDVSFRLEFDPGIEPVLIKGTHWTSYGEGLPATFIHLKAHCPLPWRGTLSLRAEDVD